MSIQTVPQYRVFNGDKKHLIHFLAPYEKRFLKLVLPWVPVQASSDALTLMTIVWSIGVLMAGYFARSDIRWLWAFSFCILMQYITDMLDGEVGRARGTGLIKWGFYMDHFLDYIFVCSIIVGYSFLLPSSYFLLTLLCLTFTAGFMIHAFMDFSVTNDFKISCNRFGVSEMRFLLIAFNVLLVFLGKWLLIDVFPFVVMTSFLGLCFLVYTSQKIYRHLDASQQAQANEIPLYGGNLGKTST